MATMESLLADHVTLAVRSVDRLFVAGYQPRLQSEGMVVRFLLDRGYPIPSPAALGKIGQAYRDAIDAFAAANQIPVVRFAKGACKEDVALPYQQAAERDGRFGVVMIGVAQEKLNGWKGYRHGGSDAHPHFCYRRMSAFPNHYYFYVRDPEWGPGFVKTVAYAPFPIWLCLNGHEWAKRQAAKQGLDFQALDNGFRATDDEHGLAAICRSLTERDVESFAARWEARLPSPFTADDRGRGYRYAFSVRQLEISDTRVFDRPQAGRAFFDQLLVDQLTLGRPDQVSIVFGRTINRTTPGRFHTRVVHRGVEPTIQAHYKHSKVKQYFKEGRALRTETTINDPKDFGVGRLLTGANWQRLLEIGEQTNDRLLAHELAACDCMPDPETFTRLVSPSRSDGQPCPALRYGDPRTMALLACLCSFTHVFAGLTNRSLREQIAHVLPGYTPTMMTYDLRRLRGKGLIRRIPRSHRYQLTEHGHRIAVFFTKTYTRIITPGLTELDPRLPDDIAARSDLANAWRAYERALNTKIAQAAIAA